MWLLCILFLQINRQLGGSVSSRPPCPKVIDFPTHLCTRVPCLSPLPYHKWTGGKKKKRGQSSFSLPTTFLPWSWKPHSSGGWRYQLGWGSGTPLSAPQHLCKQIMDQLRKPRLRDCKCLCVKTISLALLCIQLHDSSHPSWGLHIYNHMNQFLTINLIMVQW